MSGGPDTTDTSTVSVDTLIRAATERLVAIDDELDRYRTQRGDLNILIKKHLEEQARLVRIVRASQPRIKKTAP